MTPTQRIATANRLVSELGHADILDALKHAVEMQSALRVIHTWAGFPDDFKAKQVLALAGKALRITKT